MKDKQTFSYPTKQIECGYCGHIADIPKAWALKHFYCKNCGSPDVRPYNKKISEKYGVKNE